MSMRIYIDEAGTHSDEWLVIGMLFVPNHGVLHSALCSVKDKLAYFNKSPRYSARYKETHLSQFRSPRDVEVAKEWIELFISHDCYYRSVVIDWSIWDGSYFGTPFEPRALQERRAYKKWAEMLLQPELTGSVTGRRIVGAKLYLDRLRIMHGYDVVNELQQRFTRAYRGNSPYIESFQHTDSWRDANQCLQLCDLLTGALYQSLVPANKKEKTAVSAHLATSLQQFNVQRMDPGFWRQYDPKTLSKHFPKFSAWFWRPAKKKRR